MWDSGVSRDEPLGSASLNLEMALENSIQVSFWGGTWGLLSYRGGDRVLTSVSERLTPPSLMPHLTHLPLPSHRTAGCSWWARKRERCAQCGGLVAPLVCSSHKRSPTRDLSPACAHHPMQSTTWCTMHAQPC